MKLNIQLFGGRGSSSSIGNTNKRRNFGGSFFGEEKGGFPAVGDNRTSRYFAGDTVTKDGKEYLVSSVRSNKIELYSGDETLTLKNASGIKLKERGRNGEVILAKERVKILRSADSRTTFNNKMVGVYNKPPRGFTQIKGAMTAPKGYELYSNNKSLFGDERIVILVKRR